MAIAIELSADTRALEAAFSRARDTVATQTAGMVSAVGEAGQAIESALTSASGALSELGAAGAPAFDQLENVLSGFGVQLQVASGAMQFWLNALALGMRGFSIQEFATNIVSANHELAQLAVTAGRLGLTTDQIQQLTFAMKTMGGLDSTAGLKSALDYFQRINAEFHEVAGGGAAGNITKLFQANGLAITNAAGEMKSFNDLLRDAALLISNAASDVDKLQIAKLLGLTQEWVSVLEKGPAALNAAKGKAAEVGAVIDERLIKKAQEFDTWWNNSWSSWTSRGKAAAVEVGEWLRDHIFGPHDAAGLFDRLEGYRYLKNQSSDPTGPSLIDGAIKDTQAQLDAATAAARAKMAADLAAGKGLREGLVDVDMSKRGLGDGGFGGMPLRNQFSAQGADLEVKKPSLPTKTPTTIPSLKNDATEASDAVERYTNQLEKAVDVLKAQLSVQGLGNAERVKAVDMARAEAAARERGSALTDKEREKIEGLAQAHADATKALENYKKAQQAVTEATNFFGSQAIDIFDQMIFQGAKASDVMRSLASTIVKAALQASLLGSGPLAGLFGTSPAVSGQMGGLLGSLFNLAPGAGVAGARASGGPVESGKSYLVGENGPEIVRMGGDGHVVPNNLLGGASGGAMQPIINVRNYAGVQIETSASPGPGGPQIDVIVTKAILADLDQRGPISRQFEKYGVRR